ncbi:putative phage related protein exported protein [Cupriavidus taiwanensis]|uniref:Putative phage related protein exported protein n=1 Tax=Cupriavidus taiwanensis TaxID=164546 RepID=A0A375IG63_9BURK|nr:hypothetical protein [Cupriavidus taiwanensis]SPK73050.1 putative phage related protein exported protein [Cupriavidus taiwanensis]
MNRTLALALTALALLATAAILGAWFTKRYADTQLRAENAETTVASLRAQLDSTEGSIVTVTRYVDRIRTIEVKGDTIIKEIPRYVPAHADAACTVPVGFVRLHDAAATGTVLHPGPGDTDAGPSGLALSAVTGTVADNYTTCHRNAEQLSALQATLRAQGVTIIGEASAP